MGITTEVTIDDVLLTTDNKMKLSFVSKMNDKELVGEFIDNLYVMRSTAKKGLKITIEKIIDKRSLDANAYCWVLCGKIAEKLRSTKEEIYIDVIKKVGQFEIIPIKVNAVQSFVEKWSGRGLGWFCEIFGKSKLDGYTNILCYFGSSVYNTIEMKMVVDELIDNAKSMGIETKTPNEVAEMLSLWGKK